MNDQGTNSRPLVALVFGKVEFTCFPPNHLFQTTTFQIYNSLGRQLGGKTDRVVWNWPLEFHSINHQSSFTERRKQIAVFAYVFMIVLTIKDELTRTGALFKRIFRRHIPGALIRVPSINISFSILPSHYTRTIYFVKGFWKNFFESPKYSLK